MRYEGHHGRAFRATLNQLIKLTQTGIDLVEDQPEPAAQANTQTIEVKSVMNKSPEPSDGPGRPAEAPTAPAPNKAIEVGPAAPAAPPATVETAPVEAVGAARNGSCRPEQGWSPRLNR